MIDFRNVTFIYPNETDPIFKGVSFSLPKGSFTLVTGESGAGKSTLLRCINGLVPHFTGGTIRGEISVCGLNPIVVGTQKMSKCVGFVFQDPETQFVLDRVEDEIAFALENVAYPQAEMRHRVDDLLDLLEIKHLRQRDLHTLSGGECQKVAIASSLSARPGVLVLDEPTSQLDPQAAKDVLETIFRLNHELGLTIVIAEHRLERILPYVDQMIYLPGRFHSPVSGAPEKVLRKMRDVPPLVSLGLCMGWNPLPLTVAEARAFVNGSLKTQFVPQVNETGLGKIKKKPVLTVSHLRVAYEKQPVLRDVSFELRSGEITCLIGENGAGKTTLLKSLVGLLPPDSGVVLLEDEPITGKTVVEICKKVGYLPQNPNALLFAETLREEWMITLENHRLREIRGQAFTEKRIADLLERLGLQDKEHVYPRDMSVGERQRVALGAVTITQPQVVLLDEPTRGLDYHAKRRLGEILKQWKNDGLAILLITHDVELVALIADRLLYLNKGEILANGAPKDIFGEMEAFAPQMIRLLPEWGMLTAEDVCAALSKQAYL